MGDSVVWREAEMFKFLKVLVATSSVSIAVGGASLAASDASAAAPTSPAAGGSCTPTTVPQIYSVSAVAAIEQTQTITITGKCFGSGNTFTATDNEWFQIIDKTGAWSACHISSYPENDTVTCTVRKWTNSKIVFTEFNGYYGQYNYTLQTHDRLQFCVWNLDASDTSTRSNAATLSVRVK
jgi:hypothetical protein